MAEQYSQTAIQKLPSACTPDITAPTFSGVSLLTPQPMGSIKVDYSAATDTAQPINYEIYVLPGTVSAATLFASTPALVSRSLSAYPFTDSNGSFIVKGTTYTVGVRARDAVGNLDSNTAILTCVAIGSANLAQIYQDLQTDFANDHIDFQADHLNFQTDHTNFLSDLSNFQTELLALASNNSTFAGHLSTLATDLSTFAGYLSTLGADLTTINGLIADIQNVLDSVSAAGGTSVTAQLSTETVLNIEEIEVL